VSAGFLAAEEKAILSKVKRNINTSNNSSCQCPIDHFMYILFLFSKIYLLC
jgi:hypothetical protein